MNRLSLFVISVVLNCSATSSGVAGVPLDLAIRTGKVQVTITGRGVSSGDAINLSIQKNVPTTMNVDIDPGTVFRSESDNVQSMVFRCIRFEKVQRGYKEVTEIVLNDGRQRHFILEAYCRDHGKPTPRSSDQFVIGPTDKTEAAVIAQGTEINVTNKILQVAIWIQRSGDDLSQLRSQLNVSADEFKVAVGLVESAQRRARRPATIVASDVEVELKNLMAGLRKRVQTNRDAATFQRGDRVKVGKPETALTATRNGKRVVSKLSQGDEIEVIRVVGDRVLCLSQDDAPRRGWLAKSDLGRVVAPRAVEPSTGLLRESALEVLDKLDINVNTDDRSVTVEAERQE